MLELSAVDPRSLVSNSSVRDKKNERENNRKSFNTVFSHILLPPFLMLLIQDNDIVATVCD